MSNHFFFKEIFQRENIYTETDEPSAAKSAKSLKFEVS